MNLHLRSLAVVVIANSLSNAAPPATITVVGAAPNLASAGLTLSRYFADPAYLHFELDEGLTRFQSRWSSLSQASIGMGWEMESSSHLFFRTTASVGAGILLLPGDTGASKSEWLRTITVSPEMVWFPYGRFRGASMGFTMGIHLQYRSSLTPRPLPGQLPGANAQFFAGLVL